MKCKNLGDSLSPTKQIANPGHQVRHHEGQDHAGERRTKPHHTQRLRAGGHSLLPPALRPCLLALPLTLPFLLQASAQATSITLSIPAEPLTLTVTSPNGKLYKTDSITGLSLQADAPWGYELSVQSDSDDGALKNGDAKLASVQDKLTETQYSADGHVNTWGYAFRKATEAGDLEFAPGPKKSASTVLDRADSSHPEQVDYALVLGAKVDGTIPEGNYSGTLTFSAAVNAASYTIDYNLVDGTGGPNPAHQTGSTVESSLPISSDLPTRDGYGFKGWCTVSPSDDTCSGQTYAAGANIPLENNSSTITLYAMWHKKDRGDLGTMQNFQCAKLPDIDDYGTATDSRDGNTYRVARLRDNKCWMVENLKIQGSITLTPENSDMGSGIFELPASSDPNFAEYDAPNIYINDNPAYGGYYNWFAATAGSSTQVTSGDAKNSICAKGWKLPTQQEFKKLAAAYNYNSFGQMLQPPVSFVLSEYYIDTSFAPSGHGSYWSSTLATNNGAYRLDIDSTNAYTYSLNANSNGRSMRCMIR